MRFLVSSLIFWAICSPLFYFFGLPVLIGKLEAKARGEAYAACQKTLEEEHLANAPASPLSPAQAETYCHCVSDPIAFTKGDLIALARTHQSERLTAALKPVVDACNQSLQQAINESINTGAKPHSTWEPDGTETVHFN